MSLDCLCQNRNGLSVLLRCIVKKTYTLEEELSLDRMKKRQTLPYLVKAHKIYFPIKMCRLVGFE